jgi:hypothetical protein
MIKRKKLKANDGEKQIFSLFTTLARLIDDWSSQNI